MAVPSSRFRAKRRTLRWEARHELWDAHNPDISCSCRISSQNTPFSAGIESGEMGGEGGTRLAAYQGHSEGFVVLRKITNPVV